MGARQIPGAVDDQARTPALAPARDGDFDASVSDLGDTQQRSGVPMTEDAHLAAGENGSHPAASLREPGVADGVDALVDAVQPPSSQATIDERSVNAQRQDLCAGDDTVLTKRDPGQHHARWRRFACHIEHDLRHRDHSASVAATLSRI